MRAERLFGVGHHRPDDLFIRLVEDRGSPIAAFHGFGAFGQVVLAEREAALEKRKEAWAADRKTYTKKARQILRKLEKKGAVITLPTEQAD